MGPEGEALLAQWALDQAETELGKPIERFVQGNQNVMLRVRDHQWYALLQIALRAQSVQAIQQFLHQQGTRSTRPEWRQIVERTFGAQTASEPLWFTLIHFFNWLQEPSSPPQRSIRRFSQQLRMIYHEAKLSTPIPEPPEHNTAALALARVATQRLVSTIEIERDTFQHR